MSKSLTRKLPSGTIEQFHDELTKTLATQVEHLYLDCAGVTEVPTGAIGELISLGMKTNLTLTHVTPELQQSLLKVARGVRLGFEVE